MKIKFLILTLSCIFFTEITTAAPLDEYKKAVRISPTAFFVLLKFKRTWKCCRISLQHHLVDPLTFLR